MEHIVEFWGEFGIFTNPGLKVERFSEQVMTPSAARGALSGIYHKPRFAFEILKIEILSPIQYVSIRKNELKNSVINISSLIKKQEIKCVDISEERTQRNNTLLIKPHYYVHFSIIPYDTQENTKSLDEQFARRAKSGKYYYHPYMGCREYPAFFRYIESEKNKIHKPILITMDLGPMIHSLFDLSKPDQIEISKTYFNAEINNGIMIIPPHDSYLVTKDGE